MARLIDATAPVLVRPALPGPPLFADAAVVRRLWFARWLRDRGRLSDWPRPAVLVAMGEG